MSIAILLDAARARLLMHVAFEVTWQLNDERAAFRFKTVFSFLVRLTFNPDYWINKQHIPIKSTVDGHGHCRAECCCGHTSILFVI